jgi:hypothetical protein
MGKYGHDIARRQNSQDFGGGSRQCHLPHECKIFVVQSRKERLLKLL